MKREAMFSSPMAHYFRHALLAYKTSGKSVKESLSALRKLSILEANLKKLRIKEPGNARVELLIEKVRKMKAGLP